MKKVFNNISKGAMRLGLVLFLALGAASPSFASTPDAVCGKAFDAQGEILQNSVVCPSDVGIQSLQLFVGNIYHDSPILNKVFTVITGYEPTNFATVQSSGPIAYSFQTSLRVAVFLVSFLVLLRIFFVGWQVTSGKEDVSSIVSSKNLVVALVALLLIANDGVISYFQAVILTLCLLGYAAATWLLTLTLPSLFSVELANSASEDDYPVFMNDGEVFASSLVSGIGSAQGGALYTNYLNIQTEGALIFDTDASWWDSFFTFFKERVDPTVEQVQLGKLKDTSLVLSMSSPIHNGRSAHGMLKSEVKSTLEITTGRTDGKVIQPALFLADQEVKDIFDGGVSMSVSNRLVEGATKDLYTVLAADQRVSTLAEKIFAAATSDEPKLESAKELLVSIINDTLIDVKGSTIPQILNVIQSYILGAMSITATQKQLNSVEFKSTPFDLSSRLTEEPFRYPVALAEQTLDSYRREACLKNLSSAWQELSLLYNLKTDHSGDLSTKYMSISDEAYTNTICLYQGAKGKIDILLSDEILEEVFKAVETAESGSTAGATVEQLISEVQRRYSFDNDNEPSALSKLADAKLADYDRLVSFFAMLTSVSRAAALEVEVALSKDKVAQMMKETRQRGSSATATSFATFAARAKEIDTLVLSSKPSVAIGSRIEQNTGIIPMKPVDESDTNFVRHEGYIPIYKDLSISLDSDGSARETLGDTEADTTNYEERAIKALADILLPNEEVIKNSYGFDERQTLADSLIDCATTKTCVEFNGHPIQNVIRYNETLFSSALMMVVTIEIIDSMKNVLDLEFLNGDDAKDGDIKGKDSKAMSFLKKIGVGLAKGTAKVFQLILSAIMAVAGVFLLLGYSAMAIALAGSELIKVMLALDTALMIINYGIFALVAGLIMPLIAAACFVSVGNKGALAFSPVLAKMIELALKPILFYLGFWCMYFVSYPVFFVVNAIMGSLFSTITDSADVMQASLTMMISMVVYIASQTYVCMMLIKVYRELPAMVLSMLSINGTSVGENDGSSGAEKLFAASTVMNHARSAIKSMKGQRSQKTQQTDGVRQESVAPQVQRSESPTSADG